MGLHLTRSYGELLLSLDLRWRRGGPTTVGAAFYGHLVRILHTSDWHLGRSFHREDLLGHQGAFIDHLLEVVESEKVDVVVVSGDVYDRALPHVDAVALADETFARLAASRAKVVVSSGNHDSAQRLGFGSRLMDFAGVHVRTDASSVGTPVVLKDRHGDVAIHAIPYLDPSALLEPWGLSHRSHEAALTQAMTRVRADLAARTKTRSVVLAHAFVAGAEPSESERDISVGGVSRVATSVFDGIDYTALGHLHGSHVLAPGLRYSGSPLAYSFSEADQVKGSWLVELSAKGLGQRQLDRRSRPPSAVADLRQAQRPAQGPVARRPRGRLGAGHADRRAPARPGDGAAASPVPAHPGAAVPRRRRPTRRRRPGPRPAPATTRSPSTSCATCAARKATKAETTLLQEAVDGCCHDPDQDVLVGASVPGLGASDDVGAAG